VAAATVAPPASRNAACPCGSGRRYKDCHGALAAPAAAPPAAVDADVGGWLTAALAAQQAGRLRDAAADYRRVLERVPDQFDALHMLGVVHFQQGEFDDALVLVKRAVALRPDVAQARSNLSLIESSIERRGGEAEMCRVVLPRLAWLCDPAPPPLAQWTPSLALVVDADATADAHAARERLLRAAGATAVDVWSAPAAAQAPAGSRTLRPEAGEHPRGGSLVVCGARPWIAPWLAAADPARVAWLPADDAAGVALDRLRELAQDGRRRVSLLYPDAAHARRWGLPGLVLGGNPSP
jgi:tetratricopeptide (TPR) repeat protein